MHILVVHNTKDTPGHDGDAHGAFVPEAVLFERHHRYIGNTVERIGFDNLLPASVRATSFLSLIDNAQDFDAFVYLGHGLRNALSSAQIDQAKRPLFTSLLAKKAKDKRRLYVTLYACSTGETPRTSKGKDGDDGFADKVRDDLEGLGFTSGWVDGHTIAAHATMNPYLRRFELGPGSNEGGDWLVEPKSLLWSKWTNRLKAKAAVDPFRFDFPYLTADAVRASLV